MTKEQKKQIDNLYNFSVTNEFEDKINFIEESEEKNKKRDAKEREKRIKQKKKNEENDKFDLDTETVIGMTNRNNQKHRRDANNKIKKRQMKIERKKKKIKRIIRLIVIILICAAGGIFALVSPIFNIQDIQVVNNNQIATETIVSLSQLQKGQNLFKYRSENVKQNIKTNPYVNEVYVKRIIPNKVQITVKERERNFNVEFLNGYFYINNQGYILEISEQKLDLPVIQGISTEQEKIVEGNRLNEHDLGKLETVIQIINICKYYELDKKVSKIDITDKTNFKMYMESENKEIYLGDETNLSNKMLYVTTILEETKNKEGTIYVNGNINENFKPRFREKV